MTPTALSPDTQAALLLCGHLGERGGPRPLSLHEYNVVATWLRREGARPADLLAGGLAVPFDLVDADRQQALLERGAGLAFAVEAWERRGLWVVGRADPAYPRRLRALGSLAPPVLYGAGGLGAFDREAVAVVGSRDADDAALDLARQLGQRCAAEGLAVVTGGETDADRAALAGALDADGVAVAVLAEGVARPAVSKPWRGAVAGGRLALVAAVAPQARRTARQAADRSTLVYAHSAHAVVLAASPADETEPGARDALAAGWAPVLVRTGPGAPGANRALVASGAAPLDLGAALDAPSLRDALATAAASAPGDLFS